MILRFTLENYRSFRDEYELSLVAGSGSEHEDTHTVAVPRTEDDRALRSAVVYGPNASGKTNILLGLKAMRDVVVTSASESQRGDPIDAIDPFRFDPKTRREPTTFEVEFVQNGIRYQYGFEATRDHVVEEWLYAYPKGQAQRWYTRRYHAQHEDQEFNPGDYLTGQRKQIWEATRPNALYLSTGVQLNNEKLEPIFDWFRDTLRYLSSDRLENRTTILALKNPNRRRDVVSFLREADLGIDDVRVREISGEEYLTKLKEALDDDRFETFDPKTHTIELQHGPKGEEEARLELSEESHGTQRFFALTGPILNVIEQGQVLAIDELDSSLHPLLVRAIVELFNDPETNPHGAQLIFNTHDTTLLDQDLFRRDQIWFTEKFEDDATRLVSLLDFKPRKGTEALEKNYLRGRYGALPLLRLRKLNTLLGHAEGSEGND